MQSDRLADFRQRRSGLLREGEGLAPSLARSLHVPLVVKLGALRLGERFPFGVLRHEGSLLLGPVSLKHKEPSATRTRQVRLENFRQWQAKMWPGPIPNS